MNTISLGHIASLWREGRLEEAWALLAPTLGSAGAEALEMAGLIAAERGQVTAGVRLMERSTTLDASRVNAWINLCALRAESGDAVGAASAAEAATRLAPRQIGAWVNLGSARCALRDFGRALEAYGRAEQLAPADVQVQIDLAAAEFSCGEIRRCAKRLQAVVKSVPGEARAFSLLLLALHHATNDPIGLAQIHQQFFAYVGGRAERPARTTLPRRPGERIRLGLVSADFFRHSVWYFLGPLLDGLPGLGFDLVCFHTDTHKDEVTQIWRGKVCEFIDLAGLPPAQQAAQVRSANLDILLSLGGHTTAAMPTLFAERLAPVQGSFLGYPGPLGFPTMDVWLADGAVSPPAEMWPYPESPLRLTSSYFCYRPGISPEIGVVPEAPDHVVFGSFNTLGKVSAVTVRLWSDVLRRCENSTLILKADAVRSPTRERLQAEFQQLGIGAERITWLDWSATREEHLACYRMVDIALDTFPYNGATTTCEALWMGVPVVSLSGKVPASRMGRSILRAAGLEEWVTDEASRFVELACELARNFRSVRQERGALRGLVSSSALCAESRYCSEFSQLLRGALAAVN